MRKKGPYEKYFKRPMDFTLALMALVVLSPVLLIVAILIKLDSKGSIFFTQKRPGKGQKIFNVYKFRTMVENAAISQKVGVEVIVLDHRITKFGKFLRRYKIDEFAQIVNIIKGDMSIVGPRPTLIEYIQEYEQWELQKFEVRPGLTGLAQTNGNIYLSRQEKSYYDIRYVENITFFNDVKLILKTVAIVFWGEDKYVQKINVEAERNG